MTTPETNQADPASAERTAAEPAAQEQLVPGDAAMDYKARWEAIQQGFVDDPRRAVSDADNLVGDVLDRLSRTFEDQHQDLESDWNDGEPDTEELRTAFQRYRTFFDRLVAL